MDGMATPDRRALAEFTHCLLGDLEERGVDVDLIAEPIRAALGHLWEHIIDVHTEMHERLKLIEESLGIGGPALALHKRRDAGPYVTP